LTASHLDDLSVQTLLFKEVHALASKRTPLLVEAAKDNDDFCRSEAASTVGAQEQNEEKQR
jgi:hypothetical protein